MPQITLLALIAALITFLVTNPTNALTPEEQANAGDASEAHAPPIAPEDAELISEKTRLIKQERERREQLMDDAVGG